MVGEFEARVDADVDRDAIGLWNDARGVSGRECGLLPGCPGGRGGENSDEDGLNEEEGRRRGGRDVAVGRMMVWSWKPLRGPWANGDTESGAVGGGRGDTACAAEDSVGVSDRDSAAEISESTSAGSSLEVRFLIPPRTPLWVRSDDIVEAANFLSSALDSSASTNRCELLRQE